MSATARLTVLVTGAADYVAAPILPALRKRFHLRLVDVYAKDRRGAPGPGVSAHDLRDPDLESHRSLLDDVNSGGGVGLRRAVRSQ